MVSKEIINRLLSDLSKINQANQKGIFKDKILAGLCLSLKHCLDQMNETDEENLNRERLNSLEKNLIRLSVHWQNNYLKSTKLSPLFHSFMSQSAKFLVLCNPNPSMEELVNQVSSSTRAKKQNISTRQLINESLFKNRDSEEQLILLRKLKFAQIFLGFSHGQLPYDLILSINENLSDRLKRITEVKNFTQYVDLLNKSDCLYLANPHLQSWYTKQMPDELKGKKIVPLGSKEDELTNLESANHVVYCLERITNCVALIVKADDLLFVSHIYSGDSFDEKIMNEYRSKIMEHLGSQENLQVCIIGYNIMFPHLFTLRADQKTIQINEFKSIDDRGDMDVYFDAENNQIAVNSKFDGNWHIYQGVFLTPEQMKLEQDVEQQDFRPK
ncbi:hypothetical protein OQJ19_08385 [Fluoribacter gormanii]|uniref:Uncharacterized protein n=1 Tax=Fluoribacter gormanii TaxID=464 RepID=A0A377GNY3_9GAMM|nr:hypothetical protein [Fluoribacter gormanii]KTD04782.1 hypothetical protein Lgor_0864 [Fluoribacter gormanii]MCW8470668.1 hypothetical protein [Fluoribacter gormanii]SIR16984.1 hypothetical protein SAMN05421777_107101 [Fluoribacter gormanii]STO26215.1 Uncharacterised protein [Fluoribacter gormanii]